MSKYGLKIKNYQAGSVYEVMTGVRNNYDSTDAMLTNSLFSDFICKNGLDIYKGVSTRDIICIEFKYGSRSYNETIEHFNKSIKANFGDEEKIAKLEFLKNEADKKCEQFDKQTVEDIRTIFYTKGVDIRYAKFDKAKKVVGYDVMHYKMLYRTPGKAKKGSCMFIVDRLYDIARNFLYMGIKLPEQNAPIVEIGAYSSLITSTVEDRVQIKPEEILILKDVDSVMTTNALNIELDENGNCVANDMDTYDVVNTMFDGQALIDESIFPTYANGYILLRHHFTKMAAFCTKIQKFFREKFGDKYETTVLKDMWGNKHYAKDIKLITTNNAVKWLKFKVSFDYWSQWVRANDCMFGIVKTAHRSKLGNVQRMSYQMNNALSMDTIENTFADSKEYVNKLKTDDLAFIDFLRKNSNFSNDYEVLIALYNQNNEFARSSYFRERRKKIITGYVKNLKTGRTIQNADNLVIVGSPYALLLHAIGEDPFSDPTFAVEDGCTQCWTERFGNGEYLAEFRSPFNSQNNLGYLHNSYHEFFDRYFKFGEQIIAVNMNGTDFQCKNNGSDMDSDSIYTTNQPDIVTHAKYCVDHYPVIVNSIPMDSNHYDNTLENFALIDNKLAGAQRDIGESSNLAQVCLTYTYNMNNPMLEKYVAILAVLA